MNQLDRARKEDRRRKRAHWLVTVSYADQGLFGRVYTDCEKAERFAARQLRSPQVEDAKVKQISQEIVESKLPRWGECELSTPENGIFAGRPAIPSRGGRDSGD
jgi:hypothetical protein